MNDPIEEILKEYEARHEGHIPDECCVDFVWLEPKLHALVEGVRAEINPIAHYENGRADAKREIAEWAKNLKKDFADDPDIDDGPRIFANSLLDDLLTTLRMREEK